MKWQTILKDIQSATRSASLWSTNDYNLYRGALEDITFLVKRGHTKDEVLEALPHILSEKMAHLEGFMSELENANDGISEVDWAEVAENYDEDIDTIIADYQYDMEKARMPLDGMEEKAKSELQPLLGELQVVRDKIAQHKVQNMDLSRAIKFEKKVLLDLDKAIAGLTHWK